ncbi:hypothetical protein ACIO6U_03035 [Streptomyces sp. NPDC087422]|uniref:hypothetical protein n=1 Tax=Streptomyces sp. NPDC087422 TaxID=3365786 RepID=UPI00381D3477
MTAVYVVTLGGTPLAFARSLEAAQDNAVGRETRHRACAVRWVERGPGEWRLMSRHGGDRRLSWSQYGVRAVPEVAS